MIWEKNSSSRSWAYLYSSAPNPTCFLNSLSRLPLRRHSKQRGCVHSTYARVKDKKGQKSCLCTKYGTRSQSKLFWSHCSCANFRHSCVWRLLCLRGWGRGWRPSQKARLLSGVRSIHRGAQRRIHAGKPLADSASGPNHEAFGGIEGET